jgi:hypothetical protein
LNKLFSKCAADAACSSKFPQLRSRFIAALPRLRQQPLSVGEERFDDVRVIRFIRNWLYPRGYSTFEQRIQHLLIFMDAAARGDSQLMVDTRKRMRKEEGLDKVQPPSDYARQAGPTSPFTVAKTLQSWRTIEGAGSSEIIRLFSRV